MACALSRYVSSLTVYEIFKISLETEGRQTADLRADLLRQDKAFCITNDEHFPKVKGLEA
jgi:hypothetical protein